MGLSRRQFVAAGAGAAVGAIVAGGSSSHGAEAPKSAPATAPATTQANDRLGLGVIGCGGIARWHGQYLKKYTNVVAVCDVDKGHAASYNKDHADGKAVELGDYRKLLERKDVDVVLIASPDHWHAKLTADALRAGKDVYCEKPLTLTIEEGRFLCKVVRETSRILQVGTQQRSETQFLTSVALAHAGRLGKIRQVTAVIGATPKPAEFKPDNPPADFDWDMWLGQAPKTPYIKQRTHNEFRWWYEYSGGIMTDWGAHHVDIAQWAFAPDLPGPTTIEPVAVELPQKLERGYPTNPNTYNTAAKFNVKCTFSNGVNLYIRDKVDGFPADNGVLFEGDGGWCFVNREKIIGTAVDRMKDDPLPKGAVIPVASNAAIPHERHLVNFLDCVRTRQMPISDVWSHHRNLTTCHLANIAMRLGRKIKWDASAQEIVGDGEADAFQSRAARKGFEVA